MNSYIREWKNSYGDGGYEKLLKSLGLNDFSVRDLSSKLGYILENSIEGNEISREDALYLTDISL
ncbi:MAG: hypothetical protein GTO02_11550, partial [Candidatus Dadabacteria bacterium]|nr:hypothetical protein [Candidatus Dadabacteria bacterium]NIQ14991.1 hypothetical protein [Candidatus Dadabacteria bacterium]